MSLCNFIIHYRFLGGVFIDTFIELLCLIINYFKHTCHSLWACPQKTQFEKKYGHYKIFILYSVGNHQILHICQIESFKFDAIFVWTHILLHILISTVSYFIRFLFFLLCSLAYFIFAKVQQAMYVSKASSESVITIQNGTFPLHSVSDFFNKPQQNCHNPCHH